MNFPHDASDDAVELGLFTENYEPLYRGWRVPITRNLTNKAAKGQYVHARAVDAFLYLADEGAKKYNKEFGRPDLPWHKLFPMSVRREVAEAFANEFETEYKLGNFDEYLTKTAAAARKKATRR